MNALESLEKEVTDQVNQMAAEAVFLLIERWEARVLSDFEMGKLSVQGLLDSYVNMKITLHRVKRSYERDNYYSCDMEQQHRVESFMVGLNKKIKDARRNYYVAKHRYNEPDQHGRGCSCRGCRCIEGISGGGSGPAY